MATLVVSLSSRKARDPSVAGGKGAGLALLIRARFPVPPGFVITTAAFREPLDAASRLNDLEAARRLSLDWEIPDAVRRSIFRARRRLGPGPVAVRSSLVGEDSGAASFAGQLETVLDVEGDDALLEAVRRVLASAFSERLRAYKGRTAAQPLSLAVVVQSMVPAVVSGVAFSCDPTTARPGAVIEACRGPCEALVQGRVRPDRYRLDPRGEIDEIVPAEPGSPLLDEPKINALGELIGAIAEAAGSPRDVEWAFDGRAFRVLQARPISSLAGKPVYSRRMVSDMAPGLVKPLVWSAKYAPVIQNVFAPVFEEIAGPTGLDYSRMSARLHSRVYMNVTAFGEVLQRVGLPSNFFYMLARGDKTGHRRFRPRLRTLPGLVRHVRFIRRESRIGRRVGPFLDAQRRKLDRFRGLDWSAQTPAELLGHAARLKELHGRSQWYVILVSINMLIRSRVLAAMIVRRWPGTDPRDVIRGYGRRSSLVPFEELRALAEEACSLDRELLERMTGEDGFDPAAAPAASERGRALMRGFEAFMDRFGFLSANGSDFSETPWVEDPRLIWRTIGRLALRRDSTPSPAAAEARREEVLGLVRSGFGPLRRRVFDRLHASTVRYMDCRERVSLLMTEDSYWMRRCFLTLGARLVERGTIAAPEDVFYLFEDELPRVLDDPGEAATAAGRIAARKAELERDAALDPPDTLCGGEIAGLAPPTADGIEFLAGIGASAGVVRGRARIVRDPASAARDIGPGDVLVVPFTDIGWLPVLAGIGGVVADTGGQLSHTSIIAREYGIPAVVSVRNATRLIPDGAAVTVDGTAGRIYIHKD
jgi:phosphohistidine swiveling domain-containing protein